MASFMIKSDLFLRILSLKAENSLSIGCRLSIKPLYFFCLGGWCSSDERVPSRYK